MWFLDLFLLLSIFGKILLEYAGWPNDNTTYRYAD